MQQTYYCPNCGAIVIYGAQYCGNCRNPINWQTHQQIQPPPIYQQPPGYGQQQWGYQQQPPYQQSPYQQPPYQQSPYQQPSYHQQYGYGWQPYKKQSSSMWPVILLIAVVVLFGVGAYFIFAGDTSLFGNAGPSETSSPAATEEPTEEEEEEPEPEPIVTEISAKELIEAYEADAEVAKEQYDGKLLIITGTVDSMDIGGDSPYVLLTGGETYTTGAKCVFDPEDVSKLFQIELGSTIKIQGKVGEYILDVTVENCTIVQ